MNWYNWYNEKYYSCYIPYNGKIMKVTDIYFDNEFDKSEIYLELDYDERVAVTDGGLEYDWIPKQGFYIDKEDVLHYRRIVERSYLLGISRNIDSIEVIMGDSNLPFKERLQRIYNKDGEFNNNKFLLSPKRDLLLDFTNKTALVDYKDSIENVSGIEDLIYSILKNNGGML